MAKQAIYRVYLLDVWGNERTGWEVNDRTRTRTLVTIDFEDDANIIEALKEAEQLGSKANEDTISIDGDCSLLYICVEETGMPILELEFVEGAE